MPKGGGRGKTDVGMRNIPNVCSRGHAAVSPVQLEENLALWCQGRIWQSAGKWGHCRDRALEIKHPKKKKKNSTVSLHQCSSGAHVRLYMCVHDVCSTVCRLYVSVHDARVSAGIQRSNQEIKCSVSLKLARTKTLELSGRNRPLRTQRGVSESLTRTVRWLAKGIKMLLCQPHSVSISV